MYAFTSMGVVVLSTVVFILSTMPELTDDIDMILFTNTTTENGQQVQLQQPVERWEQVDFVLSTVFQLTFILGNSHSEHSWPSDYGILYIR